MFIVGIHLENLHPLVGHKNEIVGKNINKTVAMMVIFNVKGKSSLHMKGIELLFVEGSLCWRMRNIIFLKLCAC